MDYTVLVALCAAAAYLFCDRWQVTNMRIAREDGNRFYLRIALWSGVLFAVGWLMHQGCLKEIPGPYGWCLKSLQQAVTDVSKANEVAVALPLTHAAAAVIWALVFATLGPPILNTPFANKDLSYAFLKRHAQNMQFELLLMDANRAGAELPIQITLKSGKFYVGLVLSSPSPGPGRGWFKILPLMSGYTDDKKQLKPTTFYLSVYEAVLQQTSAGGRRSVLDFELVVPAADVQWARLFDIQIYLTQFQQLAEGQSNTATGSDQPLDARALQTAVQRDMQERDSARTSSIRRIVYLLGLGLIPVAFGLWAGGLTVLAIVVIAIALALGFLSGTTARTPTPRSSAVA